MLVPIRKWLHSMRAMPSTLDRRFAFATPVWVYYALLGTVVITMAIAYRHAGLATTSIKIGPYMGLGGALTVCIGAFGLARPIIRAGGYRAWHENDRTMNGGKFPPPPEQIQEDQEGVKDAFAVNVIAPSFGIVGTIINGASGFFS